MPHAVTSAQNQRIRWLRKLSEDAKARRREGLCVAEGLRLAEEVLREGLKVALWVLAQGWGEGGAESRVRTAIEGRGEEILCVSREILRRVADTRSPQGVLCAVQAPVWEPERVLSAEGPVLLLDRMQDPGNLGTLARSAEGAGAAGILLVRGSVDPGNPKALRASAGSLFRLPCAVATDPAERLRASGRAILATAGSGGIPYYEADLTRSFALVVGQEAGGLSRNLANAADCVLTVPMAGRVESLNASTAASVILFEAARQRALVR